MLTDNNNINNDTNSVTASTNKPKFSLPEKTEKEIDLFLAKVERHEFKASEGISAQLQCSIEAIDLYTNAFNELGDDPEEYWSTLVAVNSRLQSAPALRILFSNLAKRVAKHVVEGLRSCEEVASQTPNMNNNTNNNNNSFGGGSAHGGGGGGASIHHRAPTTNFATSMSMLQMDEYIENLQMEGGGGGSVDSYSPQTNIGGGGQFPNMMRVPTAAILCADNDGNNGGNNNNGGGEGNNGNNTNANNNNGRGGATGATGASWRIDDVELMTPAAAGHQFTRQPKQHQKSKHTRPSAFKKVGSSNSNNNSASEVLEGASKNNNNNGNNNNDPNAKPNLIKQRRFIQVSGAREAVEDHLGGLKEEVKSTTTRMSKEAQYHIQSDETVMAFGCTNTLTSFFKAAAETVRFRVFLIETANGSGASSLESTKNMTVERICMSNCYSLMTRVSKVFLSTEAVFANGGLVAFAGSHAVCLAAKLCTVPVIVVVASIKFSDAFPSDSAGTTLIKVDQSRSVEWRDFLPPADILPPQYGSASDGFDCLYDTDSSSDDEDEYNHEEDQYTNGNTAAADLSNMGLGSGEQNLSASMTFNGGHHQQQQQQQNMNGTSSSYHYSNQHHQQQQDPNDTTHGNLNSTSNKNIMNQPLYSPRTQKRAKKTMYRRHRPPVQVWNPLNEYVPPDCISIFVTELHEITPALVQVFVESLNEARLN